MANYLMCCDWDVGASLIAPRSSVNVYTRLRAAPNKKYD